MNVRSAWLTSILIIGAGAFACDDDGDPPGGGGGGGGTDGGGVGTSTLSFYYHRPLTDYDGWSLLIQQEGEDELTIEASEADGFGSVYTAEFESAPEALQFRFSNGTEQDPAEGWNEVAVDEDTAGVWFFAGDNELFTEAPPAIPGEDQAVVYYLREDGEYDGWGLHLWRADGEPGIVNPTAWEQPLLPEGIDERLGAYFVIDLQPDTDIINFIVHLGDAKDPGDGDRQLRISEAGNMVFLVSGVADIFTTPQGERDRGDPISLQTASAHWLTQANLVYTAPPDTESVELRFDAEGAIVVEDDDVVGGEVIILEGLDAAPEGLFGNFPHLQTKGVYSIDLEGAAVGLESLLRGQLVVVARDARGEALNATRVQMAGVLDDRYGQNALDAVLGASYAEGVPTLRVWAPTAQDVVLERYSAELEPIESLPMTWDESSGVWSISGEADWDQTYYRYAFSVYQPSTMAVEEVTVTDPYSVSLSENSAYSQIVDLSADYTKPAGWDELSLPVLEAPEDVVIYEGHVRDFSIWDESVDAANAGKFAAFADANSQGMQHLRDSEFTVFHMLPAFDIATINEAEDERVSLADPYSRLCELNDNVPADNCETYGEQEIGTVLEGFAPTSEDAQQVATWMAELDGFNWGYDPYHYTVPEGSYASNPNGVARVIEFREMVAALANATGTTQRNGQGLRLALDVVYNHTNAAGLTDTSVLDRIVPGYYHRLDPESGAIATSTCCQNTATEHLMMEKLMVDSVKVWAEQYKVGAFRFDLMGHHMKSHIENVRTALDEIDESIYVYGEGWDFGEVGGGQRGPNATQILMAGTGIGTFNDRLRDGVRGGGPFDEGEANRSNQGFITGLYTAPNNLNSGADIEKQSLLALTDLIRVGMAGNLKDYPLINSQGEAVTGQDLDYGGAPGGYTEDPQETITYVSAHDNQTLFDIVAYKLPLDTDWAQRVRHHHLGLAITALGQGVPFFHMGIDLLRSKSMERDSFNSGDWFNRVDWTRQTNNWNVGLPNEGKDAANWPFILDIVEALDIPTVGSVDMQDTLSFTADYTRELLEIRRASPLFRLRTKEEVINRVKFHNMGPDGVPGLIVQSIADGPVTEPCAIDDLDPDYHAMVVIINATRAPQEVTSESLGVDSSFVLHPSHQDSVDEELANAQYNAEAGAFEVPALSTAVFVIPQDDSAVAEELACIR